MTPESSIKKIIASSEAERAEAKAAAEAAFKNQEFIESIEREKTDIDRQIIAIANEATNEVVAHYGGTPWDIPEQNIHLVPEDRWNKLGQTSAGFYMSAAQAIAMCSYPQKIVAAAMTFHEMLHFKCYNILETRDGKLTNFKTGIQTRTRPEGELIFRVFNEATVSHLEHQFVKTLESIEFFKEEAELTRKLVEKSKMLQNMSGLYYAEEKAPGVYVTATDKVYIPERAIQDALVRKLHERDPAAFPSPEDAFDLFARALFKPQLLELGRTIDQVFGVGTFRHMASLGDDMEALAAYIDSL